MRFLFTPLAERIFQWSSLLVVYLCYLWLASTMGGCSSGPQLPVTTPVLHISCTWEAGACPRTIDGGITPTANGETASDRQAGGTTGSITVGGCDCYIDRSATTAEARTTGNDNRGVQVDARLPVNVSATPTPAPTP